MPLIREADRSALRELAEAMTTDVSLTLYTQRTSSLIIPGVVPRQTCETAEQLMGEIAELMPRVTLNVLDVAAHRDQAISEGVDRVPALVFGGENGQRVRFLGLPSGHEFPSFLKSVLELGGADSGLTEETCTELAAITKPVDLKVFVTPT